MAEEKSKLEKLKERYEKLSNEYGLPEFDKLNQDFRIDRLYEVETDYLIREVRGSVFNFLENILNLIEAIQNPVSAPLYIQHLSKNISEEDIKQLKEIHKELASLNVRYFSTLVYSEKREVEAIKTASKKWDELKQDFESIINNSAKSFKDSFNEEKKEGRFGSLAG
ncbi:MAG: hypothetical protein ABEI74_01595 [Candidatus Pacearchaeota archaeon]